MNAASAKVGEYASTTSKETNKSVAKDSDASVGTRAQAGMDALGDKKDEVSNKVRQPILSSRSLL